MTRRTVRQAPHRSWCHPPRPKNLHRVELLGVEQLIHSRPTDTEHVLRPSALSAATSPSDRLQPCTDASVGHTVRARCQQGSDLLITPGCRAARCAAVLHTPQKLFPTGLAVTIAVLIATSGNSALPIGAGYMIVNELALTLAGCGAKPHSRRALDSRFSASSKEVTHCQSS